MRKSERMPNLVPSAQAAARLCIDRSTLTRWVKSGRIVPALKLEGLRGSYLFDETEVARVEQSDAA